MNQKENNHWPDRRAMAQARAIAIYAELSHGKTGKPPTQVSYQKREPSERQTCWKPSSIMQWQHCECAPSSTFCAVLDDSASPFVRKVRAVDGLPAPSVALRKITAWANETYGMRFKVLNSGVCSPHRIGLGFHIWTLATIA
jgi:hypothetical protein